MHSTITSFLAKAASATSLTQAPRAVEEVASGIPTPSPAGGPAGSSSNVSFGSRLSSLSLAAFKSPTPLSQEIRDTLQLFDAAGPSEAKLVKALEKLLRVLKRHQPHPDLPLKHHLARRLFAA
ncbi:MAG: hypothetical protein Q8P67_23900, partial [archaeon]|nr:hypothetical protein [archaeon]